MTFQTSLLYKYSLINHIRLLFSLSINIIIIYIYDYQFIKNTLNSILKLSLKITCSIF